MPRAPGGSTRASYNGIFSLIYVSKFFTTEYSISYNHITSYFLFSKNELSDLIRIHMKILGPTADHDHVQHGQKPLSPCPLSGQKAAASSKVPLMGQGRFHLMAGRLCEQWGQAQLQRHKTEACQGLCMRSPCPSAPLCCCRTDDTATPGKIEGHPADHHIRTDVQGQGAVHLLCVPKNLLGQLPVCSQTSPFPITLPSWTSYCESL